MTRAELLEALICERFASLPQSDPGWCALGPSRQWELAGLAEHAGDETPDLRAVS